MSSAPEAKPSLDGLPTLNSCDVDTYTGKTDAPFPADCAMFEDRTVDDWQVDDGKENGKASSNSPEKETVAPDSWEYGKTTRSRRFGIEVE